MVKTLRDLIGKQPEPENPRTEAEERVGAMMPGDGEATDHIVEELLPSEGEIDFLMARAKAAHQLADENPDQGAVHLGWEATEDEGGETRPYDPDLGATEGPNASVRKDRAGRAGPRTTRATPKGPSARGFPIVKGD